MNLYLLTQSTVEEYDTYDSCVVVAETEEEAKTIHPSLSEPLLEGNEYWELTWAKYPSQVIAQFLGVAAEGLKSRQVICASFNAG